MDLKQFQRIVIRVGLSFLAIILLMVIPLIGFGMHPVIGVTLGFISIILAISLFIYGMENF
ncbi:MAG: hypothetical protein PHW63_10770 [Alphaproteobacteria bacterium]|nr:hypothetical protein [Alphaproteobacteria bacterium]